MTVHGASMTEGVVTYPWAFKRTSGLATVDALLALPATQHQRGQGSEAASIAPLSEQRGGQDVYAVSGSARRLGILKVLTSHDAQWADATNMPARGHVGHTTSRGGPVYDSLGHLVSRLPLLSSTLFGMGVLEGTHTVRADVTASLLLDRRADAEARRNDGATPLYKACQDANRLDIARLLLKSGAGVASATIGTGRALL